MKQALKKRSKIEADWQERIVLALTTAVSIMLSGGVVAATLYLLLGLASLMSERMAYAQPAPVAAGVKLEAGIEKEDVDGDLKSAMEIYGKIAADTSAPREVRARALLRLAGCDEKLGRQARQIYEQIVRDYADQPAAAQARNRLALLKKQENPEMPTTMIVRKIEWAELGEMTACDTDGHRAVYRAADGNLYFGDLTGQNKRLVFKVQPGDVPEWCASRDLSMIALVFPPKPGRPGRVAVIKIDGTEYRELVHDYGQTAELSGPARPNLDWSWDARRLVIQNCLPNGEVQLIMVDTADGHHRELVHLQSGDFGHVAFSPDGNFIAYSTWQNDTGLNVAFRIFVMPAEGTEPRQVYQSPWSAQGGMFVFQRLHDWTADGHYLVISDAHFAENALYLLPLKNGTTAGNPVFVREGEIEDAHATASDSLVFQEGPAHLHDWNAYHADLDADGKIGGWEPINIRAGNDGWNPSISFSPDGEQIVYASGDEERAGKDLVLRNLRTGQEQVLYWFNSGQPSCHFAYDLPKVFCSVGWDDNGGHSDLVSVSTKSGAVEKLASFPDRRGQPIPSIDDQHIYFVAQKADQDGNYLRWETSGKQDTLVGPISNNRPQFYVPTQDERGLLRKDDQSLAIRPMLGGHWRLLVSDAGGALSELRDAVPHGDWVLFDAKDPEGKFRIYRVPIAGGEPQLLGNFPNKPSWPAANLQLSRDARQIIAVSKDESKFNLWTLANFEPSDKK
jgi:hypothetical protein